jgi:hypothetical protein
MFKFFLTKDNKDNDITDYVSTANWSGETDTVSRKLDFSIVYTTKNKNFINVQIDCGNEIKMQYIDEKNNTYNIFDGIVFNKSRATNNNTMDFNCFDKLIYLNKRKDTRKFDNVSVTDAITQICNINNIAIGKIDDELSGVVISTIEKEKSYAEMITDILDLAKAKTQHTYNYYSNDNKLYVIVHSEIIDKLVLSDEVNVISTNHSESIEDMINTVIIMDKNGNETYRITNDDDVTSYSTLSDIYKIDKKKDTQTQAKAMLKKIAYKSSLSGVGNVQCIAGYAVQIQEEMLKGIFSIKSDKHSISNNLHTMDLDLVYLEDESKKLNEEKKNEK